MNTFENSLLQKPKTQDGVMRKSTTIKTGQEVFEEYLKKDVKMHEEDFIELWKLDSEKYAQYSPENVARDKSRVEFMKKSNSYEKPDSHATVLENMFADVVEKGKFFGENRFKIIQLSEYDDKLINGAHCDTVLELETEIGLIYLGIDLTTASNPDNLNKKRNKCIEGVKSKKFATVKYFKSEFGDLMGELDMVPVVVAGFDRETVANLCQAIGKNEDLSTHYSQFIMLEEIIHELERLIAISEIENGYDQTTQILEFYSKIFLDITQKKKDLRTPDCNAKVRSDEAYKFLVKYF